MKGPPFADLAGWLAWQETLHPSEIELGLERVRAVADRLGLLQPDYAVITVAGTNGKGSVCAYLEAVLSAGGHRTGLYTSPHLIRYNERVRVAGQPVDDAALVEAFARVNDARGDVSLTYFEFGTLAALIVFAKSELDVAVLEVGLGGRLDAVNIVDADVSVITHVALDHQAWLGENREAIGREKAGILRRDRPAIVGDRDPPASVLEAAREIGAPLSRIGREFDGEQDEASEPAAWTAVVHGRRIAGLPIPGSGGDDQLANAATALAALAALGDRLPLAVGHLRRGLGSAAMPGRREFRAGNPGILFDVCHNEDAARALARWLARHPFRGRIRTVLGMLADKDAAAVAAALAPHVEAWFCAGLGGTRGLTAEALAERIAASIGGAPLRTFADVGAACEAAIAASSPDDVVLVCGSFLTVGAALDHGL